MKPCKPKPQVYIARERERERERASERHSPGFRNQGPKNDHTSDISAPLATSRRHVAVVVCKNHMGLSLVRPPIKGDPRSPFQGFARLFEIDIRQGENSDHHVGIGNLPKPIESTSGRYGPVGADSGPLNPVRPC